uniref:Uncharacterized protein n=1 Tax=Rhizophora mucronata TaxID=61149 RepID=A0A2P2LN52_RHIMU
MNPKKRKRLQLTICLKILFCQVYPVHIFLHHTMAPHPENHF